MRTIPGNKADKNPAPWRLYSSQEGNMGREKAVTNEQINIRNEKNTKGRGC